MCISNSGVINSGIGEITGLSAIIDLHKINFKTSLFKKYKIPVFIENDSNCAALAELKLGNAKYAKNSVVILIGWNRVFLNN
ncbi:ROK family protein [Spiroplasma floricola]|uniref:ROK family protein n=1 Tax=Spiroplasma floricola TaxID=216937 RepID=UPI003CCBB760